MDLTQGTEKEKIERSKKMMLWFGIISMGMMFAGLTSAYVVSKNRPDWLKDFELPNVFIYSTALILISSISFHLAKKSIRKDAMKKASALLWITLALGLAFIYLQFEGFNQILENGYYFTGSASTITTSFIYLVVIAHLAHIFAGVVVLLVVIYNNSKQRYRGGQMLGIELGATFWHFIDVLWIYLFLFLYFFR
ncbi:cytochrome c oxidase subunit 3 [Mesonia sp. MT50]|uniref:Cytochrome c oxidase subunit 3 n=1 Tax=Mesonia profundi TaxID=3070998 RepID=A0ABU1A054_9FLAO|nr:cytochrome c oxidase subunit 3 [Mesonia profundi]MDQ7917009.1 cytochrome c oxidase subunit 3 [Mesonia profundi]